jgi:CHAT domain-containing protein
LRSTRWRAIPASGREAEHVGALLGRHEPVRVLLGAEASEERFKREAPDKRILHLATHGFFLQEQCASALSVESGEEPAAAVGDNPLLLSGLVLAGANRAGEAREEGEDGVLTAEEIAALDLDGVQLAVLSACDTGRGEVVIGEGVFGLRRALELAGVRTVVMSLWPVPDLQARRWMQHFYEQRLDGAPIVEAIRGSSLRVLEALRDEDRPEHPYFWAGFAATGDWR